MQGVWEFKEINFELYVLGTYRYEHTKISGSKKQNSWLGWSFLVSKYTTDLTKKAINMAKFYGI